MGIQATFAELEYGAKKKKTRREKFLERMDGLIPWKELEDVIEPHYPKGSGRGRRPYRLSAMLRVHCVQLFYNLSDPGMEDMLYEVEPVRRFAGLTLDALPDETTILKFRHLLEKYGLGERLMASINDCLASRGLTLREGTVVDASIVEAPSSTKNRAGKRDPEMHQTRKGKQWYFGMKMHVGSDAQTGVAHSFTATPANESDVAHAHRLVHGEEKVVWGDAGYQGVEKRPENRGRDVEWRVAMRPGLRRRLAADGEEARREKNKASVRAKAEHPFFYVKRVFGYGKVRYRGLHKNGPRIALLLGLANLLIAERSLAA